ncbi:MAG: CRTAC1 family protein [Sandaracinaceae bacterium]|nr:CRTAC1 family protein [Myxococcales bacterium]MCB9659213.1 CRTAC1 family protein [Sandaracinaceae bacterium]
MTPTHFLRALSLGFALHVAATSSAQGFTDVASEVGLTAALGTPDGSVCPGGLCAAAYGGTASTSDLNGDGFPDLYVAGPFTRGTLYLSTGDGSFSDATAAAGLASAPSASASLFADLDQDGDSDLVLARATSGPSPDETHHIVFYNVGTSSTPYYEERSQTSGLALRGAGNGAPLSGTGIAAGDYNLDGYVDLFVGSWQILASGCDAGTAGLYRNLGTLGPGRFRDVTRDVGAWPELGLGLSVHEVAGVSFGGAFSDLDQDGLPDLLVTADFGRQQFLRNAGTGGFTDETRARGLDAVEFGMGSSIADADGDGDLDVFFTSIYDPDREDATGNRLHLQRHDGTFAERSLAYGVRDSGWGWGATFVDLDNDGDIDLATTGGNDAYPLPSPLRLWVNQGSLPWIESAAALGVEEEQPGRALLAFDFDRDGDEDLLVVRYHGPPLLLRNDLPSVNAWLTVVPRGTRSNRDGWGAKVWVTNQSGRTWYAEVGTASHFTGVGPREAHVGLGPAALDEPLRVEVEFLGGNRVAVDDVLPNRVLTVTEPDVAPPRPRVPTRVLPDCDHDGLPDACGYDCDADGTPDECQIAREPSLDVDTSGFLDVCEGPRPEDGGTANVGPDLHVPPDGGVTARASAACTAAPSRARGSAWLLLAAMVLARLGVRLSSASTAAQARTRRSRRRSDHRPR